MPVIQIDNVSKSYRLGAIGGGTLREDVARWWARVRGRPDPCLKIGQEQKAGVRGQKSEVSSPPTGAPAHRGTGAPAHRPSDLFWALRNVSLEVKEGEILGIIGRNGAGKSTLLKILSRVTGPTEGEIRVRGRIASLLEVGTGFHPELTGRENVFLNGAILGMTKPEIRRKFDEIVDFSGVEQFIDTPVKRYSSGMYVRLAFAVAAHLEPEILVVDEVLAVGDAEFQKRCLGKMGEVARGGRTVLFVSHNMAAISSFCSRAILLDKGHVDRDGAPTDCVARYTTQTSPRTSGSNGWVSYAHRKNSLGDGRLHILRARILSEDRRPTSTLRMGRPATIEIEVNGLGTSSILDLEAAVDLSTSHGQRISRFTTKMSIPSAPNGRASKELLVLSLRRVILTPNRYVFDLSVAERNVAYLDYVTTALTFDVVESDVYGTGYHPGTDHGMIYLEGSWALYPLAGESINSESDSGPPIDTYQARK